MKKVAVIGAGNWGKNLVRTFFEIGALAAVAEPNPDIREALASLYPEIPFYESFEPILQSEVPAVAIATPVSTHFSVAKAALLAGKDVFVEKPITASVPEAQELLRLSEEHGLVLMVGHLLLYQPAIQWIKQYLDSGELGELYSLHQQRAKLGRVRSVENALLSLGVHDVAVLLYLVGQTPRQVSVQGQPALQPQIEDDVYLHLSFAKGVKAHLHASWLWPLQERRLVVVGSRGMLVYDEIEQTVTLHRKDVLADLTHRDQGAEVVFRGSAAPLTNECQHFLQCVDRQQTPLSGGENGIAVLLVIEEAIRQLREGVLI